MEKHITINIHLDRLCNTIVVPQIGTSSQEGIIQASAAEIAEAIKVALSETINAEFSPKCEG